MEKCVYLITLIMLIWMFVGIIVLCLKWSERDTIVYLSTGPVVRMAYLIWGSFTWPRRIMRGRRFRI